jgi:hypothetical protein
MPKLIIVVRYDFDESEPSPVMDRMDDLYRRLGGFGDALVWVATGDPCERVSAAVDAESCCDLHNTHCEPPGDLCCQQCTEAAHPHHPPGTGCVLTPELHPTTRDLNRLEGP